MKKLMYVNFGLLLLGMMLVLPSMALAHPAVILYDEDGNKIIDQLQDDGAVAAGDSLYKVGPAYSPKQTCGKCHDYDSITKAYHFREGTTPGPNGGVSDTWVSENAENNAQKYLTNAYGHLLSPGQYGAW